MLSKLNVVRIFFGISFFVLFVFPKVSYADWAVGVSMGDSERHHHEDHDYHDDHGYYGWHDHPHYGWHYHHAPSDAFVVWVDGERYYYRDGLYYRYIGDGDFILVDPPMGAYVDTIPPDFQPVMVNGRTYYADHGVYYMFTDRGYRVVHPPVVYQQPTVTVVSAPSAPVSTQNSFPINIPNGNGSFTTIVIKKSGNGYVGPQGEFYATFPSVAQLKAMYVKN